MAAGDQRNGAAVAAGGTSTPRPQWASGIIEALAMAQRSFQPDKAMQVVAVMEHLPEVQKAMADFYDALGRRSVDSVDLPPSTAEFFAALGSQQQRQHGALATAMHACKRSVQEQVVRILGQRKKDEAWDVSRHRAGW